MCELGLCTCPGGQLTCDGACFDTQTSPERCGDCDTNCGVGNECVSGGCLSSPITTLTGGRATACVLRENGQVACWRLDTQANNGRFLVPTVVNPVDDIVELGSMNNSGCARILGGQVWCWGNPNNQPLGRAVSGTAYVAPGPVAGLQDAIAMDAASTAGMIPKANSMGCAVRATGSLLCWGQGDFGQLGVGNMDSSNVPVDVVGL